MRTQMQVVGFEGVRGASEKGRAAARGVQPLFREGGFEGESYFTRATALTFDVP